MFFQYPAFTQQMIPVCSIFLHQVFCDFWIDCKFDIFGFRSTSLCLSLHDTHLINGFVVVFCIHRWSSHLHPPPTHRRVAHTHLGEFFSFRPVVAPLASPGFLRKDLWWIQSALSFSVDERPFLGSAWTSHAVRAGSHSFSFNRTSAVYVIVSVFFCLFLGLFVFSPCNSLLLLCLEPLGSVPTLNHLNR
jgi:hypothetical protein